MSDSRPFQWGCVRYSYISLLYFQIFSEKLAWKSEPKVDTGLHRRTDSISLNADSQRYNSSKHQVAITIEPIPSGLKHTFLEPVLEVEYQSAADLKRNQAQSKPLGASVADAKPFADAVLLDQTDGPQLANEISSSTLDQDWKHGPPVPPKPPRCIHKQWELENRHTSGDIDGEEEREILTFTKEELDEILKKRDIVESQERNLNVNEGGTSEFCNNKFIKCDQSTDDERKDEYCTDKTNTMQEKDIPISDITNEDLKNRYVDHKEDTVILERLVIDRNRGKENDEEFSKVNTSKKKSGFVSKMKRIFTTTKKEAKKNGQDKRFSSTSFNINRSNSNSSRISVKGKKLKRFASEEEKEIELMVKYLGYHSPKLARKVVVESAENASKTEESVQKKKQIMKRKDLNKIDSVEKLAYLGYSSPKLAKNGGKAIIVTGSPTQKRKAELNGKGIIGETVESFKDENDRVDHLGGENVARTHVKEGISSDYQEVDFGANVSDIKNGRLLGSIDTFEVNKSERTNGRLPDEILEKPVTGIVNQGYEYDDVASEEGTDDPGDDGSGEYSEDERHTSVAELTLRGNKREGIQTTIFKYKIDQRPTSSFQEIRQERIMEHSFPSGVVRNSPIVEDSVISEVQANEIVQKNKDYSRKMIAHDNFEYAVVRKMDGSCLLEQNDKGVTRNDIGINSGTGSEERIKYDGIGKLQAKVSPEVKKETFARESRTKVERKHNPDKCEHELTLEEELKSVLSNIQDSDGTFLRTTRRHEGTETGSRPGTPKISVKPIWMKAEEECKGLGSYGMRRYMSDENVSRSNQQRFVRSNRTQSLLIRKPAMVANQGEPGCGKIYSGDRTNLARSSNILNLSCSHSVLATRSIDDQMDETTTDAPEYRAGKTTGKFFNKNEEDLSVLLHHSGSEEKSLLNVSESGGKLHGNPRSGPDNYTAAGRITIDTDAKKHYRNSFENVDGKNAHVFECGSSADSCTDEVADTVIICTALYIACW